MIALHLTNVKDCMSHLLRSDTFDNFLFIEGDIVTFNTFTIDGFNQKTFFAEDEEIAEYASWIQLKEYCFSLIKGKRTPLSFKFIFSLAPSNIVKLIGQNQLNFQPQDIQGLYLNIRFDGESLHCITGTSFKSFTMDKSLEQAWDSTVQKFFTQKNIAFEIIE